VGFGGAQPDCPHCLLTEHAIAFQTIPKGASAYDLETIRAQRILEGAVVGGFEEDEAILSARLDPIQFVFPILDAVDHSSEYVPAFGFPDEDPDLMAFRRKAQVHIAKAVPFPDPQKPHRENDARLQDPFVASHKEGEQPDDEEDEKEDFGYAGGSACDAPESKKGCDKSYDQKNQ
jgi:hypothetical protein